MGGKGEGTAHIIHERGRSEKQKIALAEERARTKRAHPRSRMPADPRNGFAQRRPPAFAIPSKTMSNPQGTCLETA